MGCNNKKYPCSNVQRPSCAQIACLRPVNSGSTAITVNNQMQRIFDDMFDPFTNIYQQTNFICRPRNNRTFPVATQGTGAPKNSAPCREEYTKDVKDVNGSNGIIQSPCCVSDGNPNNSTINVFEAQQWRFDDQYNPMTDLYQLTNTRCRSRTATATPVATQGSGSFINQRLNEQIAKCKKDRRKGQ